MIIVAALYQFARFDDPAALRGPLLALCQAERVCGTLLLAPEGINGTIAGTRAAIDAVSGGLTSMVAHVPPTAAAETGRLSASGYLSNSRSGGFEGTQWGVGVRYTR